MENPTYNPPYFWVEPSKQRSTFGILSVCFATTIICVWSTIHLNVPFIRHTRTRRFFLQVSWMVVALLAPEALLYLAMNEKAIATGLMKRALVSHPRLAKPGMLARAYNYIRAKLKDEHHDRTSQPHFGLVHAFYAVMGGFAFYGPDSDMGGIPTVEESLVDLSTNPRFVVDIPTPKTVTWIMEHFPQIITNIHEETILDRAESSSLSKAVLIVQVAWFCSNCALRLNQRLPLSLLEVSTAAHGFCTLLTYFVWWSKPFNVAIPTIMRGKQAREVYALLKCDNVEYGEALEMARNGAAGYSSGRTGREKIILAANALHHRFPYPQAPLGYPRSRFSRHKPNMIADVWRMSTKFEGIQFAVAFCPALYGVIHFLAWNDHFPSHLERVLWRVSTVVVTFSGILEMQLGVVLIPGIDSPRRIFVGVIVFILCLTPTAHIVSSGFLIVESVRQVFFLEPAAYQLPSWTDYWPHLS